jgi:hypothetical protein
VHALASEVAALGTPPPAPRAKAPAPSSVDLAAARAAARARIASLPKARVRTRRWPTRSQAASAEPYYAAQLAMLLGHVRRPVPKPWYDPDQLTHDEWQILFALASMALTMILAGAMGVLVLVVFLGDRIRELGGS